VRRWTVFSPSIHGLRLSAIPLAAVSPPQHSQEGTRVSHPAVTVAVELPDDTQLAALQKIVLDRYPILRPNISSKWADQDKRDFDMQFRSAFRALALFPRNPAPDTRLATSVWIDRLEGQLRSMPRAETAILTLQPLTAAALGLERYSAHDQRVAISI
jgi:hypothetical protein